MLDRSQPEVSERVGSGASSEPRRPGAGAVPASPSRLGRLLDPVRWEPGHQRLAALSLFGACSRGDIRTLARAGDECFVPAGTVLCREGRIGYWLFVVTSGAVQLQEGAGGPLATLRSGSHFGEVAIIGFGPQPVTAVVVEDATLFVLGRRYVLDLVHTMPGFRVGLFPGVSADGLAAVVRSLRSAGMAAWQAMPRRAVDDLLSEDRVEQLPPTLVAVPARARPGGGAPSPFASALSLRPGGGSSSSTSSSGARAVAVDRRVVAALASVVLAALVAFAVLFHPDVLVVRPSRTIDVTRDVFVPGLPPPTGRYVVTAVDIEETNLAGLALAAVRGEDIVPRAHGQEAVDGDRAGRASYHRSQAAAASLVARSGAAIDPSSVRFRDRGLVGPSAGLLYALVLADMAGVVDVPRGRVVAATGELTDDGGVRPVSFVDAKRAVARRAGATVFLVPASGGSSPARGTVAVSTFDEALAAVGS